MAGTYARYSAAGTGGGGGGGEVTSVTATSPIVSSGGSTPNISILSTAFANQMLSNLQFPTAINQSLLFGTDATLDIGALGASRANNIYAANSFIFGSQNFSLSSPNGGNDNILLGTPPGTVTGDRNVGAGSLGLGSGGTLSGGSNTSLGFFASGSLTSASFCTTVGQQAGVDNVSASGISAFGSQAVSHATAGPNDGFGLNSLSLTSTGIRNSGFSTSSGMNSTTGNDNSFFGNRTGLGILTASQSTFLGSAADASGDFSNAMALGYGAIVTGANFIQLGNTSVTNVFTSGALNIGTSLYGSTAAGSQATYNPSVGGLLLSSTSNASKGFIGVTDGSFVAMGDLAAVTAAISTVNASVGGPPGGLFICADSSDAWGNNPNNLLEIDNYGEAANMGFGRANGTPASPAYLGANNKVGVINFAVYNGTSPEDTQSAQIFAAALNAQSSSDTSSYLRLQTTPSGTTSMVASLQLQGNSVIVGPSGATGQHTLNTSTATPAAGAGTFTNLPAGYSGNPTGYVQITINGGTHVIPFW